MSISTEDTKIKADVIKTTKGKHKKNESLNK